MRIALALLLSAPALCRAAGSAAADAEQAPLFPGATAPADVAVSSVVVSTSPPPPIPRSRQVQQPVTRGVHMTGWAAGSSKARKAMAAGITGAGINCVVIALKEYDGKLFVKGVPEAVAIGAYVNAIPDLPAAVKDFKDAGIYTVGRVVLFKDDTLARRRPEWAVHKPDGKVWTNYNGTAWVDPYRKEVWEYNLAVAERAAEAGFDEIQFDYVRFPSDGPLALARYSRPDHDKRTAAKNIVDFLAEAERRLRPKGVKISIAVFGLTTTDDTGMGIGQRIGQMTDHVDYVSPMMYPSHYAKGEYGIKNPNRSPYKTIQMGLRDADRRLGGRFSRLRPYFQDFSLGHHYGPQEVKAQILAAARLGVTNWILWNPQNRYTWAGIPKAAEIEAAATAPSSPEPEPDQEKP